MHRSLRIAVVAVLSLTVGLGLTACNSAGPVTPTATPTGTSVANTEDLQALEYVQVTGPLDAAPTVTVPSTPFNVVTTTARLVRDGDGAALEPGQGLLFHRTTVRGYDGETVATTWGGEPEPGLIVGSNVGLGNTDALLAGAHVGARLLVALPGDTQAGGTTGTVLFVIDVVDTYPIAAAASGTPVPAVPGLPVVGTDAAGVPSTVDVTGEPPKSLVVQPLIQGDGPVLADGQAITVHYVGWMWDGTRFESSWEGAPVSLVLGSAGVVEGWSQGLTGQTVGSRVLLVVPPDLGYGDEGTASIPGGSTLIFVVDVLAAV